MEEVISQDRSSLCEVTLQTSDSTGRLYRSDPHYWAAWRIGSERSDKTGITEREYATIGGY